VYTTGWPLAVWSALSDPQSWLWQGAIFQSTPALRGSLFTTAVRLGVVLTNIELGGVALKAMETDAGEGGAAWLLTVVVGPDPHPRNAKITAVNSSTLHLLFGMIIPQKNSSEAIVLDSRRPRTHVFLSALYCPVPRK
jgi:hypothetical protein